MRRIFSRDTVESLYPLYQYFLGIITFGAYNQYRATKIMESNQKTQQLQQAQFMEKMETLHHMEMIEFDKKLNELREKIRVLEQKRHGWWASLTA